MRTRIAITLLLFAVGVAAQMAVPFLAQLPPGDSHTMNCGPDSVLMVASKYLGTTPTPSDIKGMDDWLQTRFTTCNTTCTPKYPVNGYDGAPSGYHEADLVTLASEYFGLSNSAWHSGWSPTDLVSESNQYPVIIGVCTHMVCAKDGNGNITNGHFMVLLHIDDQNVQVNDPGTYKGDFSKYQTHYSRTLFDAAWDKTVITIHPNNSTVGSFTVKATLDGGVWPPSGSTQYWGDVNCQIQGLATPITYVPVTIYNTPLASLPLSCGSGGPGILTSITGPVVSPNGNQTYTINFSSSVPVCSSIKQAGSTSSNTCPVSPALVAACSCSPNPITSGQPTTCSSSVNGGIPPFNYAWTTNGVPIGSGTNASIAFPAAGTYPILVTVSDSSLTVQNSAASCSVTVNMPPTLAASCSISPSSISFGQSGTVSAVASGGVPPYVFQMASGLAFTGTNSIAVFPKTAGTFNYSQIVVKDSVGAAVGTSCSANVTGPNFSASCSVAPNPVTLGQGATVSAQAAGGVPPYQFRMASGQSFGSISTIAVLPSAAGTYTYTDAVARDSIGQLASTACSTQVNSPPTFLLSTLASTKSIIAGSNGQYDFGITPQNGFTGTVTWQLAGIPSGVVITNSTQQVTVTNGGASFSVFLQTSSSANPGSYPLTLTANSGSISQVSNLTLNISPLPLSVGCSISPNPIPWGQGATVTASGSGGYTPYQYQINSAPLSNVTTLAVLPGVPGMYTATVKIVDSQGQQATNSCSAFVNSPPQLTANCTITPNPVPLGNGVTVSGSASGGAGGYLYNFGGGFQQSASIFAIPQTVGAYTSNFTVKDSLGTTTSTSCSTNVQGTPPTVTGTSWNSTPQNRVNFSGTISGNAFTSGATVWFCVTNTSTCFQQPPAGVFVNGLSSISVSNVNLTTGSWQAQVITPYGSAKSSAFSVF